jgi:hypothetical protein
MMGNRAPIKPRARKRIPRKVQIFIIDHPGIGNFRNGKNIAQIRGVVVRIFCKTDTSGDFAVSGKPLDKILRADQGITPPPVIGSDFLFQSSISSYASGTNLGEQTQKKTRASPPEGTGQKTSFSIITRVPSREYSRKPNFP